MIYKQGRTFPPTAQGASLVMGGLLAFLLFFIFGGFLFLIGFYLTAWVFYSRTKVNTKMIQEGYIVRQYGLFPVIIKQKIYLDDFDAAVIKKSAVKYRVGGEYDMTNLLATVDFPDSFVALHLKRKRKYEMEMVFKGTKREIIHFIEDNLLTADLRFFDGAIHKDQELNFKKTNEKLQVE